MCAGIVWRFLYYLENNIPVLLSSIFRLFWPILSVILSISSRFLKKKIKNVLIIGHKSRRNSSDNQAQFELKITYLHVFQGKQKSKSHQRWNNGKKSQQKVQNEKSVLKDSWKFVLRKYLMVLKSVLTTATFVEIRSYGHLQLASLARYLAETFCTLHVLFHRWITLIIG